MTVYRKETLLAHHASAQLRLMHAAFVDSYEIHAKGHSMPVNRLLFVCGDGRDVSTIKDLYQGTLLRLRSDCVYFIPCCHAVDIDIVPHMPFVSLQFNLHLFYGFDLLESHPRCEVRREPRLVAEIRRLLDREGDLGTLCRINEILYRLCAAWIPENSSESHGRLTRSQPYRTALDFVRDSGDATTTVSMLAQMVGMRKDVFSRKFTRDIGITPKGFLTDSLVRKASDRLLAPGASIKEVAAGLQFSSEFYFSHFFKRHTAMTPTAFRNLAIRGKDCEG